MSSTTFVDQVTPVPASWLNDVNTLTYNGGQLGGMRNRIINGDMRIDQRGGGSAITLSSVGTGNSAYCLDRWIMASYGVASAACTAQRISSSVDTARIKLITTNANTANLQLAQRIEAVNIRDSYFKNFTASAIISCDTTQTIAWSLWAAPSDDVWQGLGTGNTLQNGATPIATGVWSVTTSDTKFNTGSVNYIGSTGVMLIISRNVSGTGQYMSIGEVQVERSNSVMPFEQRPYGLELSLCQRYYQPVAVSFVGYTNAGGNYGGQVRFQGSMRPPSSLVQIANNTSFSQVNVTASTSTYIGLTVDGVTVYRSAIATSNIQFSEIFAASAEL